MVNWYKHDIPAWMDNTESLPDGAYRTHHVICQLIYLNEGPIRLNEKGIAGRCNQHILAFRKHMNLLLTSGRLTLNPDQTLSQPRANLELERIGRNRVNAGLGGKAKNKSLINNTSYLPTLKDTSAHKTREEKTRLDKKDAASAAIVSLFPEPEQPNFSIPKIVNDVEPPDKALYREGKEILGKSASGMITNLLKAKGGNVALARAAILQASTKENPRQYIGGVLSGTEKKSEGIYGDDHW